MDMNGGPGEWPSWSPGAGLTPLEQRMLAAAAAGEPVDLGVGPFTLAEMQDWHDDRAVRALVLRHLLVDNEWPVDARGIRLSGVRISGHLDLEGGTLRCPLLLHWCYLDAAEPACLDDAIVSRLDLTGCRLTGLRAQMLTAKSVSLSRSIFNGPVWLIAAKIAGPLNCRGAQLTARDTDGNALVGDWLQAAGVFLTDGFAAAGAVRLLGSEIAGELNCRGAQLTAASQDGDALVGDGLKATRVFLGGKFAAAGVVRLPGADIAGQLNCSGAQLTGRNSNGTALFADGLKTGDMFLTGAVTSRGAVLLADAEIAGQLNCGGARLDGRDNNGRALFADRLKVGGDMRLTDGFTASGVVRLLGADIAGQLNCSGAQLTGHDGSNALVADGLKAAEVFLDDKFTAAAAVRLRSAQITGTLRCTGARLTAASEHGYAFDAERLKAALVALDGEFAAAGAVRLTAADIAVQLNCRDARLTGRDEDGNALVADLLKAGSVLLDNVATTAGAVRLLSADFAGQFSCGGARLDGRDDNGRALFADRLKVGDQVRLTDEFTAAGIVRLLGADIAGTLNCGGAQLTAASERGNALYGERMKVGGDVFLDEGFTASGAVCLLRADIAGQLKCRSAQLTGCDNDGRALHGDGIKVGGAVVFDGSFTAAGTISLASARADTLRWAPAEPICGQVNLEGATVRELDDDWSGDRPNGHWPAGGLLRLDGFTYGRFSGRHKPTATRRLEWIHSQYQRSAAGGTAHFATQPYEQLTAVYRQAGQDTEAGEVAIARRADLRKFGDLKPYRRFGNWFLDKTIKYGYQTWRAAAYLAIVFVAFLALSIVGQHRQLIVPVGNIHGLRPVPSATQCTSDYPCFYPFGYTIDTVIPLINVHQADFWGPDGHAAWGWVWVSLTWTATVLGWALATLLVAGYTGLVRQD